MGGEMCVAVKYGGKETITLDWTNCYPDVLFDPEFLNGGEGYKRWLSKALRINKWPKCKLVDIIEPSEYGVLLIDLDHRQAYSQQGYTEPGRLLGNTPLDQRTIDWLGRLVQAKFLSYFRLYNYREPTRILPPTDAGLREIIATKNMSYEAHIDPLQLHVTQHYNHRPASAGEWDMAKHWAELFGWKSQFAAWPETDDEEG